jgi:16S rRNA (guanine1207-N2)-methyltransferase
MPAGPATRDAALETLLLPFADGTLAWPSPDRVLFLRARHGPGLPSDAAGWRVEQGFHPAADALLAAGIPVEPEHGTGEFDLVLVLPPRQRQESRALLGRAWQRLAPGGVLVAAQRNDEGARSLQADVTLLFGTAQAASKHHCRVVVARRDAEAPATDAAALAAAWLADDAPRAVGPAALLSRPGVFAWDHVDPGSALLIENLPSDLAGRAADLGAGIGVLSLALLSRCPGIASLDLYEAEARALALARANVDARDPDIPVGYHWHDVTRGLPARYDTIVSNPPFHVGREPDPGLGQAFIAAAAAALAPGGRLWLVANRQLPYEAALGAGFASVRCVVARDGYKIIEARRAGASA